MNSTTVLEWLKDQTIMPEHATPGSFDFGGQLAPDISHPYWHCILVTCGWDRQRLHTRLRDVDWTLNQRHVRSLQDSLDYMKNRLVTHI